MHIHVNSFSAISLDRYTSNSEFPSPRHFFPGQKEVPSANWGFAFSAFSVSLSWSSAESLCPFCCLSQAARPECSDATKTEENATAGLVSKIRSYAARAASKCMKVTGNIGSTNMQRHLHHDGIISKCLPVGSSEVHRVQKEVRRSLLSGSIQSYLLCFVGHMCTLNCSALPPLSGCRRIAAAWVPNDLHTVLGGRSQVQGSTGSTEIRNLLDFI